MPITITKDGRTIRTAASYTAFRRELHYDQAGDCITCGNPTSLLADLESDYSFHIAHRGTRGIGGSLRDDVLGPKKGQIDGGKCGKCHRKEHNERNRGMRNNSLAPQGI